MSKYELEDVNDGVWLHSETPNGQTFSIFVNARGSGDGVIIDLFSEGDMLDSTAWEWSEIDGQVVESMGES